MKRPRREVGGGEVALMAVITKAMGAFLVLVVIMLPLTWLILPTCYLGIYTGVRDRSGRPLYPFLNPDSGGRFWTWVGIMLLVFAVTGFLVWAIGLLRARWQRP